MGAGTLTNERLVKKAARKGSGGAVLTLAFDPANPNNAALAAVNPDSDNGFTAITSSDGFKTLSGTKVFARNGTIGSSYSNTRDLELIDCRWPSMGPSICSTRFENGLPA